MEVDSQYIIYTIFVKVAGSSSSVYCAMVVGTKQVQLAFAFVVVPIGWRVLGFFLRRFFYRKLTVLEELKQVGKPRSDGQRVKGSAVVCGGR